MLTIPFLAVVELMVKVLQNRAVSDVLWVRGWASPHSVKPLVPIPTSILHLSTRSINPLTFLPELHSFFLHTAKYSQNLRVNLRFLGGIQPRPGFGTSAAAKPEDAHRYTNGWRSGALLLPATKPVPFSPLRQMLPWGRIRVCSESQESERIEMFPTLEKGVLLPSQ